MHTSLLRLPVQEISVISRATLMALLAGALAASAAQPRLTVDAALKPGEPWKAYATRTLDDLPAVAATPPDSGLSR
jgi:hypothetical protein